MPDGLHPCSTGESRALRRGLLSRRPRDVVLPKEIQKTEARGPSGNSEPCFQLLLQRREASGCGGVVEVLDL
jgi:hypothetical protein